MLDLRVPAAFMVDRHILSPDAANIISVRQEQSFMRRSLFSWPSFLSRITVLGFAGSVLTIQNVGFIPH